MTTNAKNAQQRATAMAAKELRARDAQQAMHEYEVEQLAIRANTARLRALRLAKEAADSKRAKTAATDRQPAKTKARKGRKPSAAVNAEAAPGPDSAAD
jgi:hypothetical protein